MVCTPLPRQYDRCRVCSTLASHAGNSGSKPDWVRKFLLRIKLFAVQSYLVKTNERSYQMFSDPNAGIADKKND